LTFTVYREQYMLSCICLYFMIRPALRRDLFGIHYF